MVFSNTEIEDKLRTEQELRTEQGQKLVTLADSDYSLEDTKTMNKFIDSPSMREELKNSKIVV